MRIAYFDCFSGVSGDMTIGAFLDAGLRFDRLRKELGRLKLGGYSLKTRKVRRGCITGTKFDCIPSGCGNDHRSLKEILAIIRKSALSDRVKAMSSAIFTNIASAEAVVHGISKERIHLHELGDVDSLVDIVGTAIAVEALGIDAVYVSDINMGRGFVPTRHGTIPVPGPAALELAKGVPVYISDIDSELATPTGTAIMKTLAEGFGPMPRMKISRIGYGAGSRDLEELPNMLRVIIGEEEPAYSGDTVVVAETNIDDMNPQYVEHLFDRLFAEGALDAYVTNIQMKKTRPAFKLSVVCERPALDRVAAVIFEETTTIGLRFHEAGRLKLERRMRTVKTKYGDVRMKLSGRAGSVMKAMPEYDDCLKLARSRKVPLRMVCDAARSALRIALVALSLLGINGLAAADVINTRDGREVRGIIVEEYKDRVVISTADGEATFMKSDIKDMSYDSEEANLIRLAEQARDRRDYAKAADYYNKALEANPASKLAKEGIAYLGIYLYKMNEMKKEDDMKRWEDWERSGNPAIVQKSPEEAQAGSVANVDTVLGIKINIKDHIPHVDAVRPDSPASEAGLKAGDHIVAVWGRLTGYMSLKEVADALMRDTTPEIRCTVERTARIPVSQQSLLARPEDLIGVSLAIGFGGLSVTSVRPDSDAMKAGLDDGDAIVKINRVSTRYVPMNKVVGMLKEAEDGIADLTIQRNLTIWRRG